MPLRSFFSYSAAVSAALGRTLSALDQHLTLAAWKAGLTVDECIARYGAARH
jgi:hypothetical protein